MQKSLEIVIQTVLFHPVSRTELIASALIGLLTGAIVLGLLGKILKITMPGMFRSFLSILILAAVTIPVMVLLNWKFSIAFPTLWYAAIPGFLMIAVPCLCTLQKCPYGKGFVAMLLSLAAMMAMFLMVHTITQGILGSKNSMKRERAHKVQTERFMKIGQ
jgi:uncharacterized membrane protein